MTLCQKGGIGDWPGKKITMARTEKRLREIHRKRLRNPDRKEKPEKGVKYDQKPRSSARMRENRKGELMRIGHSY